MAQFSILERVYMKVKTSLEPLGASLRRKRLNNTDFTIISNNCWGGVCYEYYGLAKLSPTVGAYLFADDYIRLIKNLRYYMDMVIEIITVDESRHKDELIRKGQKNIPIGVLDDVEIVFLHYKDPAVAKEKWMKRVKRINWDNIIYKFSYMNGCTDEHVHQFEKILTNGEKKVVFVNRPFDEYEDAIVIPGYDEMQQISNDTFYWNRHFDVEIFLNTGKILRK